MSDTATPAASAAPPASIEDRVAQYITVRNKIAEIKKRHEDELAPFNKALVMLNGDLLDKLQKAGVDSTTIRGVGTVYKTVKDSASIADPAAFKLFVIQKQHWELADWRANAPAVKAFLAENQAYPPGVNFRSVAVVGVRKANEKVGDDE